MKHLNVDIEQIIDFHNKGLSERKISQIMGISRSTIRNRIYDKHYNCGDKKRYDVDENFFETPDPINSYWAGFLAADGCVHNNMVSLEIHKKDERHLKKLCFLMKYNGVIGKRKNREMVSVGIVSGKIIFDLQCNFNIVPKKAKILNPPNIKGEDNIRSFI